MAKTDKRDEDGLVYYGNRLVRKDGRIKVDNDWYQHEDLKRYVGENIFIYNTGSYWETEYTCYPYWAPFKKECEICTVTATTKVNTGLNAHK